MSDTPTPPRRRWLQFSLRTMFVVTGLIAIAVAALIYFGSLYSEAMEGWMAIGESLD
jgi:hypothetical protein